MCDRRLAVDDLVINCLQDGTFDVGTIPDQGVDNGLEKRTSPKILDRVKEDLGGDPFYKKIFVKLLPSETAIDTTPNNLALIDRHLKIGQLVKRGPQDVGYVRSIQQIASARIYLSDEDARNDPHRELYIYKKPASFFGERPWEKKDVVLLRGSLGEISGTVSNVTLEVDFRNGSRGQAHATDEDLLLAMFHANITPINPKSATPRSFDINGPNGIFPGRTFTIPFNTLHKYVASLWWCGQAGAIKPDKSSESLVDITIKTKKLHMVSVDWKTQVDPDRRNTLISTLPAKNVKNDVDRGGLKLVSHNNGLKVGDVRICKMSPEEWSNVMAKWTWQNTIAKDYFLHKRRQKRPRLSEGAREVLPPKPPKEVTVEIMLTATTVEVEWMNGTVEANIESRDLVPVRYASMFPGAIIRNEGSQFPNFLPFLQGHPNTQAQRYAVIQSVTVVKRKYREDLHYRRPNLDGTWISQLYVLEPGALEPVMQGEPRTIRMRQPIVQQFNLWKNNECKAVVKRKNSTANFTYGCIIGMYTDGRIRIRNENQDVISVWPTDVVGVSFFPHEVEQHRYWGHNNFM